MCILIVRKIKSYLKILFHSLIGLMKAIFEFLSQNNNWKIKEIFTNNNGLTILEKI